MYIYEFTGAFNVLLILRDKMYLQALNDGFVVLEPGVEFLYVGITEVTELWNRIKNSYIDHSHKRLRPRLHSFACLQF
jgi:hypothetical protein